MNLTTVAPTRNARVRYGTASLAAGEIVADLMRRSLPDYCAVVKFPGDPDVVETQLEYVTVFVTADVFSATDFIELKMTLTVDVDGIETEWHCWLASSDMSRHARGTLRYRTERVR